MSDTAKPFGLVKTFLRKIIPARLLKERGVILRLGSGPGRIYARMRLLDAAGVNSMNRRLVRANARSFLFVCFGNIMRSPMAEVLFRQAAGGVNGELRAESAGLHATPGNPAHPWALTAANELGVSLADHRAKLLTSAMVEQADAIFAMDLQNLAELLHAYPRSKEKIFLLSAYAGNPRLSEIPDPYFGDLDTTRECYRALQTCIRNLLASRTVAC